MFNISDFKSIIDKRGVARPTTFAVHITSPVNDEILSDMVYMVDTVNIPGINFDGEPVRHKGYGLMEIRPSGVTFDPVMITIIADGQGEVISFFQRWLSLVMNFDGTAPSSTFQIPAETFNYPNEYYGTVEIWMYDIAGERYHSYRLNNAFPINIGAIQMGWEQSDTLMRIPITFSYRSPSTTVTESLANQSSEVINTSTNKNLETDSRANQLREKIQNILKKPAEGLYT